jgi:glyoxylase-like metal-dependent hydrolase (beta-lactamase superfamily II)
LPSSSTSLDREALLRAIRATQAASYRSNAERTPVKDVKSYGDGEVLDVPGALHAVHTPGHTGGHCALLAEEAGVLFAGDSLATVSFLDGRLGPQLVAFNEDAAAARQSLSRLEKSSASVVVLGHGRPSPGTPAEAVKRARSNAVR